MDTKTQLLIRLRILSEQFPEFAEDIADEIELYYKTLAINNKAKL